MHPHRLAAERLLREHSAEAGLDPFIETLSAAERLAMLLERLDELLRRHEIRGNAAGLLAHAAGGTHRRAQGGGRPSASSWTEEIATRAADQAARDSAEREREFADFYAMHDAMLHAAGVIDGGLGGAGAADCSASAPPSPRRSPAASRSSSWTSWRTCRPSAR